MIIVFFFSSRRRHTRCSRDWSSDVCSSDLDHQNCIDVHFDRSSAYWTDIYEYEDVDGTIYRERRAVVLALAQKLGLPAESRILEVGCGSGLTSVELAHEGYRIDRKSVV